MANTKSDSAQVQDNVIREFGPLGRRYKVRLVSGRDGGAQLDIREFIDSDTFTGFTRKGVRLDADAVAVLAKYLESARKDMAPKKAARS